MRIFQPLLLIAFSFLAFAPIAVAEDVPLPQQRPDFRASEAAPGVPPPRPRPAEPAEPPAPEASPVAPPNADDVGPGAVAKAERVYQTACPALIGGAVEGKALPPIHDGQCGTQSPLSISAVSANGRMIPLNAAVTTDCGMASALPPWLGAVDLYVAAHDKTRIKTVNLSTNYACRNVDNARTGNLSFHAFADAVDVTGFTLEDGRTISISPGFNGTPEQGSKILHFARDAACTQFMTVLGPEADAEHQDNMHLDLGCHGRSCTARICE